MVLLLAVDATAFDSAAWLATRAVHIEEAERLRTAYSNALARVSTPAEDVTVPIETFDDGSVKSVIHARKAVYFLDSGFVWAEGVVAKKFKPDGRLDTQIEAASCLVDRFSKSGWAEGPAKVTHGKTTLTGEGAYFSSPEAYVRVFRKTRIVSSDLKEGGLRP